ncbi:unnamed protein product [Phytomonas sp. EM1]|nr:unnamed protein product [Phytomonas sp. EM1]|eukprot:CCW63782.1 unnamed protein product [Phytomonas sp. isolate EM1]
MKVYNWEHSTSYKHKKVKKAGTVVFRPDESVDRSFERLQREYSLKQINHSASLPLAKEHAPNGSQEDATSLIQRKVSLMRPETVYALKHKMGFSELLPCQAQCYRGIFNSRDVILHSRTGSGKTLAYALPIIERHFIVDANEEGSSSRPYGVRHRVTQTTDSAQQEGPFLLIFVFSNDLAMQTKGVLAKIYPTLSIGIAGLDDTSWSVYNILIGTVRCLDEAIRGRHTATEASDEGEAIDRNRPEQRHDRAGVVKDSKSRRRQRYGDADSKTALSKHRRNEVMNTKREHHKTSHDDDSGDQVKSSTESEESDDGDGQTTGSAAATGVDLGKRDEHGRVCAAHVRAIVIDEVDATLGPRFSNVGRRIKNLFKFIREANGSLRKGNLHDFRVHHYVLCGATIPNWVIKAGFLGVKKYYYQLVAVGGDKLPSGLECFKYRCPLSKRVDVATQLLSEHIDLFGRVVVFGSHKQVEALEKTLQRCAQMTFTGMPPLVVRTLTSDKDEVERIANMEDFNQKVASVLLCTDIAARGLDFVDTNTVLMLSMPMGNMAVENFVHRAGRTARVNRGGRCIVLYDNMDENVMDSVLKSAHVMFRNLILPAKPTVESSSSISQDKAERLGKAAAMPDSLVRFRLTVKNPFRLSNPEVKVPAARAVLEKQVGEELFKQIHDVVESVKGSEVVSFTVSAALVHEIKRKLWKYSLEELS